MRSLLLTAALVASVGLQAAATSVADAGRAKSASVVVSYVAGPDQKCYPVSTASWSGYQVNRVRHIFYRRAATGTEFEFAYFNTTQYPKGESHSSGTMTSQGEAAATPGETWYVEALFRSNGGAVLARAISEPVMVPASCVLGSG